MSVFSEDNVVEKIRVTKVKFSQFAEVKLDDRSYEDQLKDLEERRYYNKYNNGWKRFWKRQRNLERKLTRHMLVPHARTKSGYIFAYLFDDGIGRSNSVKNAIFTSFLTRVRKRQFRRLGLKVSPRPYKPLGMRPAPGMSFFSIHMFFSYFHFKFRFILIYFF